MEIDLSTDFKNLVATLNRNKELSVVYGSI